MEPRTGKTKTTIDYMSMLHMKRGVRRFLVVCPTRVMGVWAEEMHNHCPYMAQVIIWDARTRRKMPVLPDTRSEEHTSELQSLMRISYAVFCLKKKKNRRANSLKA